MKVKRQIAPGMFNWVEVPDQAKLQAVLELPCVHLGGPLRREDGLRETVLCRPCEAKAGKPVRKVIYSCDAHGKCTTDGAVDGIRSCRCERYAPRPAPVLKEVLLDPVPRQDSRDAFNASLFRFGNGGLYLAYRTGQGGSNIHMCPVSEDLRVGPSVQLHLRHENCRASREDPRLFEHQGKLHCAFVGVVGDPGNGNPGSTHVMFAKLGKDFNVEEVRYPKYQFAQPKWEKSWSFFSWHGELFAIYSIQPHVVLHIKGDEALPFSTHDLRMPWAGGHLRGGASPVRVGDEYWSWFHGSVDSGAMTPSGPAPTKAYNIGVYAFEARPPFRPTRITPYPILWADERTRQPAWCAIIFPCGSVLDDGIWKVSAGEHDRQVKVFEWRHSDIEKLMVSV